MKIQAIIGADESRVEIKICFKKKGHLLVVMAPVIQL